MKRVIIKAKNVQKALAKGLEKLGVEEDRIDYRVLEEAKSGFLGIFGVKDAKVEIIKKEDKPKKALAFLSEVIEEMGLKIEVELMQNDSKAKEVLLNLSGDDLGIAIGHHGKTLDSLQYLSNLAINKGEQDYLRVVLDAQGYRERREKTLKHLALKMARKAKDKDRKVVLDPMPPHERRIIHAVLQDRAGVSTHSEGEDPYRKVVIIAD